jgi:glycine cleavage system aminomethyltransferase T
MRRVKRWCCLEIDAETADASGSEPIFLPDGTPVGQVSSGGYGYSVGKSLALAYLKAGRVAPGETVHVAILGRPHTASATGGGAVRSQGPAAEGQGGGGGTGGVAVRLAALK